MTKKIPFFLDFIGSECSEQYFSLQAGPDDKPSWVEYDFEADEPLLTISSSSVKGDLEFFIRADLAGIISENIYKIVVSFESICSTFKLENPHIDDI